MASHGIAQQRLNEERRLWKKNRPFGFYARPAIDADGSVNILKWQCGIPGKKGTIWENGRRFGYHNGVLRRL